MEFPNAIDVGRTNEQGHDLILAPMGSDVDRWTDPERDSVHLDATSAAKKKGWPGAIVFVWTSGSHERHHAPGVPRHVYEAITFQDALDCVKNPPEFLSW